MLPRSAELNSPSQAMVGERRSEVREQVVGCLWIIDNHTSTIMRCRCVDASNNGMRLRVPMGYSLREGQSYELTSHLPGQSSPPGMGLMLNRRARVVRTQMVTAEDEYDTEVGVTLTSSGKTPFGTGAAPTPAAWA